MRKLMIWMILGLALVACNTEGSGDAGNCEAARAAYQARIDFVGDPFEPSDGYMAMSLAEQEAYDEGTAAALDQMNRACKTGPYQE